MDTSVSPLTPAQLAKGALRRLASARLEPTPENYGRAYREEAGESAAEPTPALPARAQRILERVAARLFEGDTGDAGAAFGQALAQGRWDDAERLLDATGGDASALAGLIERITRGVERSGKNWTAGRKKESLQRVLSGSRSDSKRLLQRLAQLVASWEDDKVSSGVEGVEGIEGADDAGDAGAIAPARPATPTAPAASAAPGASVGSQDSGAAWRPAIQRLGATATQALPARHGESAALAQALNDATRRLCDEGASAERVAELDALCEQADGVLQYHQRLFDQLGGLCQELTASLAELAENDSWARGQCDAMRRQFDEGLTSRGVRSVSELLAQTREHQVRLRVEREHARDALKALVASMLADLGELGLQTGRFKDSLGRYSEVIESADSLESLAGVVRDMVEESRSMHAAVAQTRDRMTAEHTRAGELAQVVDHLETELRRLSDEVSTDQLTQVANRRGLVQAFEAESARAAGASATMAIGLLDIDNFKRLNDELGHAAGDTALKALAAAVGQALRPTDKVARYGGEEFVVLLPQTSVDEGQVILSRLQRALTGGLFMHEAKPVLVTFSAGVTAYRADERLEDALERADRAMYEAKRSGKNRTCIA